MQTRHQTDMNKRGREEHEEIGHDVKRIAVDQHPIASHVAVAPDQSKQGEGPTPPALLHFAALSAQQSYQGPPPGAYQAAQAAAAQQLNPSPVIPYHQQAPTPTKLSADQSQFHTDMTTLTGTVANSKKRRKAPTSSSRKLSAWQAYAHAHAQGINISVSMHAKQLSDQWKALPPEEKEKYANLAVELQAQRGPIVRKQKRVQTGKIYQKLKDAIDKIVHQHHTQQQTIRAHNISQQQQLQLATAGTTAASAAAATAAAMANQRVEPSDLHIAVLVFHGNSQHAEMMTYGTPSLASFYNDPHIHDIARAHASGWSFANTAPILPPLMQPPPGMPGYLPQDPNQHPHGPPPGMHMMQMPMGMGGVPMTTMQQTGATVTPGEPTPGQPTDANQQQQQQAPQAQPPQQQQQQQQPPPQPQQG